MAMAKRWNPMEDAYKSKSFNKYEQGPGADLDENLQPAAMASNKSNNETRFQLCLKNVPDNMTEKAISNLCSNYAKVMHVRKSPKTPFVFVTFGTLNDLERALEGIKDDKPQGIYADIAKNSVLNQQNTTNSSNSYSGGKGGDRERDSDGPNPPDMSRRTIKGPFTNPARKPVGERSPFVTAEDYKNSALKDVDPDQNFLVSHDMHDQDRNNIRGNNRDNQQGGKHMHTGRPYYKDSKETTENLQKLSMSSQGSYNPEKDEFLKSSPQFEADVAAVKACTLCKNVANKVCQRCGDFYCSLECQRKDWSRHRLFCFPMPELIAPVITGKPDMAMPAPKLNDSFGSKGRPASQSSDNRGGQNKPQSNYQQKNMSSGYTKDNSQMNGGDTFNRQNSNTKPFNSKPPADNSFNQGNRSNADNYGQNSRDQGKMAYDNKKNQAPFSKNQANSSFENKKDQGKNSSFESKKDQGKNSSFEQKKDQGKNSSFEKKEETKGKETKVDTVAKPAQPPKIQTADYPKSGAIVAITAVIKPNVVYIRSLASEDNVDYVQTVNLINNESKSSKTLDKMPKRGDLAVADFQESGFYRVIVINPENENKITVAYMDFGNIEIKKLSELKEIPPSAISLKRQTISARLSGVGDFEPIEKITEYLNSFVDTVGKDLRIVYTEKKTPFECELIDIATNENLNKKVNELRVVKEPTITDTPVFIKDIPVNLIPEGEDIPLIILDTSLIQTGVISCIHESDLGLIDKMTLQFAEYVKTATGPYTPRVSEVCLVQYDDLLWYRAECIEVVGDENPSVLFIDFGNLTTAHISKIRKYPKDLITPCVTNASFIVGVPDNMDQKLAERLKELIPVNEKIVVKKVVKVDDESIGIYLDDVVKTVKAEKLLE